MLVLPVKGQKYKSFVTGEGVRATTPNVYGDNVRQRITARLSEKIDSLPKARKEKVLAIRRKLEAGKYAIKERLNVATDRLIENIIAKRMEENETKITT